MMTYKIEPISKKDQDKINTIVKHFWGEDMLVAHGKSYYPTQLEGFKAIQAGEIIGILHYQIRGRACEILTLASLREGHGIGTALIDTIESFATSRGCHRLSLITTNDNLHALRFYQRRGFHLKALFPNQVAQSRKIKPSIPKHGHHGIPIRDEILLEKDLTRDQSNEEA